MEKILPVDFPKDEAPAVDLAGKCGTCKHMSIGRFMSLPRDVSQCHRFPPQMVLLAGAPNANVAPAFPPVQLDWTCGEWAASKLDS